MIRNTYVNSWLDKRKKENEYKYKRVLLSVIGLWRCEQSELIPKKCEIVVTSFDLTLEIVH